MTLRLETRTQDDETPTFVAGEVAIMITPPVGDDYWTYRVMLRPTQAVVGFPKFGTIGIGFAEEEDWNTNLPYTCETEKIRAHIWHNRADETITEAEVDEAIALIQQAARAAAEAI